VPTFLSSRWAACAAFMLIPVAVWFMLAVASQTRGVQHPLFSLASIWPPMASWWAKVGSWASILFIFAVWVSGDHFH
jgi:hypothetical protein